MVSGNITITTKLKTFSKQDNIESTIDTKVK